MKCPNYEKCPGADPACLDVIDSEPDNLIKGWADYCLEEAREVEEEKAKP